MIETNWSSLPTLLLIDSTSFEFNSSKGRKKEEKLIAGDKINEGLERIINYRGEGGFRSESE